jgi:hypothetical protein
VFVLQAVKAGRDKVKIRIFEKGTWQTKDFEAEVEVQGTAAEKASSQAAAEGVRGIEKAMRALREKTKDRNAELHALEEIEQAVRRMKQAAEK